MADPTLAYYAVHCKDLGDRYESADVCADGLGRKAVAWLNCLVFAPKIDSSLDRT